jgi:HEAT repeat protein
MRLVLDALEQVPEPEASPELLARFQRLDEEFIRRARAAWAPANWMAEEGG